MTYFCPVCERAVSNSCRSIFCDCCELWVHQNRCFRVNIPQFELLSCDSKPWFCPKCIKTSLPFSPEGNVGSLRRFLVSWMMTLNFSYLIWIKVSHGNADKNFEPTFDTTNCRYYECHDFNNTMSQYNRKTSPLHLNISSLAKHFDELITLLSCPSCNTTSVLLAYLKHFS